ncbi:WXG100 family type VII secretion target [Nocardia sp. NPDC088792]|uniref:WXG100 family type VII secretion target n=1 Tax=Nocardia sp. NPDC088792 TaxID=3364332 RepID=UPI00381D67CA
MGTPTIPQVKAWDPEVLNTQAGEWDQKAQTLGDTLDAAARSVDGSYHYWIGTAGDSMRDRHDEIHGDATTVKTALENGVTAARNGAIAIQAAKTTLLNQVTTAESAHFTVSDTGEVKVSTDMLMLLRFTDKDSAAKLQAGLDHRAEEYQKAIQGALVDCGTADDEAMTAVNNAFANLATTQVAPPDPKSAVDHAGDQDGTDLANALKNHDNAKVDEILSHMPPNVLSQADIQDLDDGRDVVVPADVQDYYKKFYNNLGKDGLISLDDYLNSQNQPGNPNAPIAAKDQTTISDSILMLSNEKIGTGFDGDGKLKSPGDYTQLPSDIRKLVSGRLEDANLGSVAPDGPNAFQNHLTDEVKFADLLSHADKGMQPGTTFGTELGRQGASLAAYIDGKDANNDVGKWINQNWKPITPDGFFSPSKALENAASQYVNIGASNHQSAYQLLTGLDVHTGTKLPSDLSFGALGSDYKPSGDYDPSKFAADTFQHTWDDKGKSAAGLVDWIGEHTHDQGPTGDLARNAYTKLPDVFAPHDSTGKLLSQGDDTVFKLNTDAFIKNPELATGLAKVLAPNIDSFVGYNPNSSGIDNGVAHLATRDAERLLFLSAQSDQGKIYLETSRQVYDHAVIDQIVHGQDPSKVDTTRALAGVDARIDTAILNAATYQDAHDTMNGLTHQQEVQDTKSKAADIAKSVFQTVTKEAVDKLPGGDIVHGVVSTMRDQQWDSQIEAWNPKPNPVVVQFPGPSDVHATGDFDFDHHIEDANSNGGNQSKDQIDDYRTRYGTGYNELVTDLLADSPDKINAFVDGGSKVQASSK